MNARHSLLALFAAVALLPSALPSVARAQTASPQQYEEKRRQANDIAVSIVVSGLSCTCARFAEDIRNVVNDLRPDGIRVLPVLGVGGLQNLNDVLFLRGIDMGVVEEDNLQILKMRNPQLYAGIEQRVQYITKLYNSEFHVLARNDIQTYEDLRGKKVSFNQKDSQTEVTAEIVFKMLNIDVEHLNYDNDEALNKLRRGEISAMIVLTGAPQAALAKLTKEDGVHFLPLDEASSPGDNHAALLDRYQPARLTDDEYPTLIPRGTNIRTIGNRALLVTYAWPENSPRYMRMTKFVREFFGKIDQFHDGARHPKWSEINIAAEIPGWTRFRPAADWIAENRKVATANSAPQSADTIKVLFNQYIAQSGSLKTLSDGEREKLFNDILLFFAERNRQ